MAVGPGFWAACSTDSGSRWIAGRASRPLAAYDLYQRRAGPLEREHITEPLVTGIRAIDSLLPWARASASESSAAAAWARARCSAPWRARIRRTSRVIALIGERNREVRAFLEHELGPEGMRRAVVVVATSDRPAPLRVRACFVAGHRRIFSRPGRERAAGDGFGHPPGHGAARDRPGRRRAARQKGYTPSVFALLPKIFERAGNFPARVHHRIFHRAGGGRRFQRADLRRGARHSGRPHRAVAATWRRRSLSGHRHSAIGQPAAIAIVVAGAGAGRRAPCGRPCRLYHQAEDLIQLGAYVSGSNPQLDAAIRRGRRSWNSCGRLRGTNRPREETMRQLGQIAAALA